MKVPVVHYWPGSAEEGALISFQVDVDDNFRLAERFLKAEALVAAGVQERTCAAAIRA